MTASRQRIRPYTTAQAGKTAAPIMAAFCLAAASAGAASYYVDVNWTNSPGVGSSANPFVSIKAGVDAANLSKVSTVYVADGTYRSILNGGYEDFGTNGITITNYMWIGGGYVGWTGGTTFDWTTTNSRSTTIDLTGAGTRAFFQNVPTPDYQPSALTGLTILNANHSGDGAAVGSAENWGCGWDIYDCLFSNNNTSARGGALFLSALSVHLRLRNCDFRGNRAGGKGGALYLTVGWSNPEIRDSIFDANSSGEDGGGLWLTCVSDGNDQAEVSRCTFSRNSATNDAGAIYSNDGFGSTFAIRQCKFFENSASEAAAIGGNNYFLGEFYMENCLVYSNTGGYALFSSGARTDGWEFDISHCTIVDNPNGGIYCVRNVGSERPSSGIRVRNSIVAYNGAYGIHYTQNGGPAPVLEYNDVYSNATADYGGAATSGVGSISLNPLFRDRSNTNYTLRAKSPCVETGTNLSITNDLANASRPYGGQVDMGAYEMYPTRTSGTLIVLR